MLDDRVQFALDEFIDDGYFLDREQSYCLREEKDSGKSALTVSLREDNLCIADFDSKGKCGFLKQGKKMGMQKSVDHIIFQKKEDGWTLHLIEMKTSVGNKTWRQIKQKVRTSYLTAHALAVFLGISIKDTQVYTTYEFDEFEKISDTVNTRAYVPLLGEQASDFKTDEWEKNRIKLKIYDSVTLPHKGIKMTRSANGEILEGKLEL